VSLRDTISTPQGKSRYVRGLFATIADRYDFITRFLSFGLDRGWKRRLITLASLGPDDRVLDLACGTGDIIFEAAPHVRQAVGLDLTHRMVQLAMHRRGGSERTRPQSNRGAGPFGPAVFVTGDMLALPFPDGHFTVVTTGYGLRNVPDLDQAIGEIRRVLAPGGRLLSLDFNRPEHALVRSVYWAYLSVVGSLLGLALHGDADTYRYIPESIRNYPGAWRVAEMIRAQGFIDVRVRPVLGGLMAIHSAVRAA
jgi:demethylmenaquinone methyltransferase/2-methoxy-6-polyprenyl-1,4-benzoquinol methylase